MPDVADLLAAERAEAAAQVASLEADFAALVASSADSNADDEHDPEGATIGFERAQLSAVLDVARRRLADVEAALERIGAGTYGVCETCGATIGAERLAALPATRRCIGCA
ncbi:MAG: DnaK suppressor protein [Frankiaceae bacterium]|nr:DnaK suppressor protein [Frankiaceae bacterium]